MKKLRSTIKKLLIEATQIRQQKTNQGTINDLIHKIVSGEELRLQAAPMISTFMLPPLSSPLNFQLLT